MSGSDLCKAVRLELGTTCYGDEVLVCAKEVEGGSPDMDFNGGEELQ